MSAGELITRFWEKVDQSSDCWNWKTIGNYSPYGQFSFNGKTELSHRFAWQLANGPIPAGLVVCHRCDNPACVRPSHLFLGTIGDNARDMVNKGRGTWHSGEKNGNAKLSADEIFFVREIYAGQGITQPELARFFHVSKEYISRIILGKNRHSDGGTIKGIERRPYSQGTRNPNSRMDEDKVRAIRRLRAAGLTLQSIADRFGISEAQVGKIALGQAWSHIDNTEEGSA